MTELSNSESVSFKGTIQKIPLKKVYALAGALGMVTISVFFSLDKSNLISFRNLIVLSIGVSLVTGLYIMFERFYAEDHIKQVARMRWLFYSKHIHYKVDNDLIDKL